MKQNKKIYKKLFYQRPFAMKSVEWETWHTITKKEFPVQYWCREVFWPEIVLLTRKAKDLFYYLKCKFWHKYHILKLRDDPRWLDSGSKIELAISKILMDFIIEEEALEVIDWNVNPTQKDVRELLANAYYWFKYEKNKKKKEYERLLDEIYGEKQIIAPHQKKEKLNILNKLEKEIFDTDTEFFKKLIEKRDFLWT